MTAPVRRRHDSDHPIEAMSAHVLVVDDDENFRAWLSLLMRRLGFSVASAGDGEEALVRMHESAFDLLVCDLEMPRMNGLEVIRVVRSTPALSNQYAVMLTSHENVQTKVASLEAGYDDFLAKSCTEVEVVAKVIAAKRMLARQRLMSVAMREWQTLATRDELTGVATRRTFFQCAERYLGEGRLIGVAIIDLDGFKPINDTYGHLTGDRILRDIGSLFLNRTRADDLISRFGGDEFLLLVVDQPLHDLTGAAERLTSEVSSLQWTCDTTTILVSATSGIAHSSLLPRATIEQLLEAADRDLYAKKWLKKNPGASPHLYEYPGRPSNGTLTPIPIEKRERKETQSC
jgi:two-component system, cell cycle response regulator